MMGLQGQETLNHDGCFIFIDCCSSAYETSQLKRVGLGRDGALCSVRDLPA